MDVIFQGQLSAEQDIREVLEDVLSLKTGEFGVLRISCPKDNLNGRLLLYKRRYIIGARIQDSNEVGYQAVRKLLSVGEGNFAYIDASNEPPEQEHDSACLDLRALLALGEQLPETLPGTVEAPEVTVSRKADNPKVEAAAEQIRKAIDAAASKAAASSSPKVSKKSPGRPWIRLMLGFVVIVIVMLLAWKFVLPSGQKLNSVPTGAATGSKKRTPAPAKAKTKGAAKRPAKGH